MHLHGHDSLGRHRRAFPLDDKIEFYRTNEKPFGVFSNFASTPFVFADIKWKTSEHFFLAHMFDPKRSKPLICSIIKAEKPMSAKNLAMSQKGYRRAEWEDIKVDVMRLAVLAKFHQNPDACEVLLASGLSAIEERAYNDSFWGTGKEGNGLNMLGKILVETREIVRAGTVLTSIDQLYEKLQPFLIEAENLR